MRVRDDDGQVLVIALGFLIFFGLVIGAMMTFVSTSLFSSERLREQRSSVYSADGVMDAAIQAGRADKTIGAFGAVPCMRATAFTFTSSTADATTATVTCASLADPIDLDRTVRFTSSVGGTPQAVATVVYHDGVAGSGLPALFVTDWTYCGHDGTGACAP